MTKLSFFFSSILKNVLSWFRKCLIIGISSIAIFHKRLFYTPKSTSKLKLFLSSLYQKNTNICMKKDIFNQEFPILNSLNIQYNNPLLKYCLNVTLEHKVLLYRDDLKVIQSKQLFIELCCLFQLKINITLLVAGSSS